MAEPRFIFRLQAVLEHRRMLEKEEQRKVAGIQQQLQLLMRQIREAQVRIALENKALTSDKLVGALDMQYIAHEKRYVGNLHMFIALTMQKVTAVEKTLEAARAQLLAAAKARKVIEKLRDKQQTRWRAELDRKEATIMDEMGTQMAVREGDQRRQDEFTERNEMALEDV